MENIWHHRKVADTSSKGCFICYKPTSSVLTTPDNKDYFYICPAHLKDRNFALPTEDEAKAIEEKKKKEALDKEIQLVKKEYEEKLQRKKEKSKKKDAEKDKAEKKEEEQDEAKLEKEKDEKITALSKGGEEAKADDGPRIFRLQKYVVDLLTYLLFFL